MAVMDERSLEHDLPALFRASDARAKRAQDSAARRSAGYLALISLAAVGGALDVEFRGGTLNAGGLLSISAFLAALILGLASAGQQPERQWYRARAVAESVKSLSWCYAVGGDPFSISGGSASSLFLARLRRILEGIADLNLSGAVDSGQITTAMEQLRSAPLEERRRIYLIGRIQNQAGWYADKAAVNDRRGNQWAAAAALASAGGVLVGVLRALNFLDVDLLGVLAATAAGFSAWMQFRQHRTLSASYAIAAQDLALVKDAAEEVSGESEWSKFVADAEDAISREHTVWLARRNTI
jgi:hypothetical protein